MLPYLKYYQHNLISSNCIMTIGNIPQEKKLSLIVTDLVSILVKEVKDVCEVVLGLARTKQVKQDQHVSHG